MRKAIIVLGIALVSSLIFGYAQYRKNTRWTGSKVLWEHDLPRDITIRRLKADRRLLDVGYDRNRDLEDDSVITYATNDKAAYVQVDEDFNGIFEVQYAFDPSDRLVARFEDFGQNGYFDEWVRYTADSVFVYLDANADGWCDDLELKQRQAR
ncbi:MAG: hypothetical protein IPM49_18055 [Flavobacteriales bacterium]|nr:hypothetical protein [Flavobacteriales bacterium]